MLSFSRRKRQQVCNGPLLEGISWYEKTQRVSGIWRLNLGNQISIAKWGIIALPNDKLKRKAMLRWMKGKPEKVRTANDQLKRDGYVL